MYIKFKFQLLIFLFLILFVSCTKQYAWQQTEEGTYLFLEDEQGVSYSWKGETFDKVAHGNGKLTKSKGSTVISTENKNAFYGSFDDKGVTNLNNGGKYIGNLVEDKMTGFGVLFQGADLYIGDFKDGKPDGNTTLYTNEKIVYTGCWENGMYEGNGTEYKDDGTKIEGIWHKNNIFRTYVIDLNLPNGIYTGFTEYNKPDGKGLMKYKNGFIYDGDWKNGEWNGFGAFISTTENVSGNWEKGKLKGNGSFISSQFTYDGEWINNDFDGYGRLDWYNGDFYEGYWKDGLQNGYGIYYSQSFSYNGNWEEGWMNGNGYIKYENGDIYQGNFVENERYGQGIYKFANGNVYDGEFVNNKFQGLGSFYFNDGYIYDGQFINGNIHGDGTLYLVIGKDSLAVTANWDGTNNIPKYVSIIFNDNFLYEGEIVNNLPSQNGNWYSLKEGVVLSKLKDINDFYKDHQETIENVVFYTSLALSLVAIAAIEIATAGTATPAVMAATATATTGAGAATVATTNSLLTIANIANKANTVINATDIAVKVSSNAIDQDWDGAVKEVATNVVFIVGGKLLKTSSSRKTCIPFSPYALLYEQIKQKVLIKIGKPFKKIVSIAKGKGDVILINSSRAKILKRLSESKFGKRALKRQTKKAAKKYGNKLKGKAAAEKLKEIYKDDKEFQDLIKKVGQNEEDLVVETSKDGWTRISYNGETSKWTSIEISPNKKVIKANGGSLIDEAHPKGGPQNEFLNHPLPNKTYIVDESTVYRTNSEGLVVQVDSDVTKAYQTHGIGNETRGGRPDYNKIKKENNGDPTLDDGGHAVGKALGGCNENINITPQLKTINRGGDWKKLEKEMLESAQNGKKVELNMKIEYAKGSRRPSKYIVEVKIDGKPYTMNGKSTLVFDNTIK